MNARYISGRKRIVAFLALVVGFLSLTYLARRNGVISYGALLIFGLLINVTSLKGSQVFKLIPLFCGIFIVIAIGIDYLPESLTSRLAERATEDSRSVVFTDLFKDMEDHMVFGKGMRGEYYSPTGGEIEDEGVVFISQDYRNGIENGYLQLFLNGGIVYDVLFILVTLPAAIIGFFTSKNQLVKSFAIIIFLWLVDMAIYGLPRLLFEYILVWIGVGVCYKKSLRQLTNAEVAEAFTKIESE
ncbi:O-antigen ligase family protein [Ferruginibacter sp.]|uniref:O-antigen ligase family protein n=1 Tax=Ferruginibacter sp. TaxID=1940288 RepID=UPI00265AA8D8|nr:O-antigen ligase family protein [Ferruginibacter sp.]